MIAHPIGRDDPRTAQMKVWLTDAGLPTEDLWDGNAIYFAFGDPPEGFAGVVRDGTVTLLRSVVVDPARRGSGIGARLLDAVLSRCDGDDIWLLTASAESFFARNGFARVDRALAPQAIAASRQFRELCAASSALMHRHA